jgi:hypothetical protein
MKIAALLAQGLFSTVLLYLCLSPAVNAVDKFSTYGALSFFGANKEAAICGAVGSLASVRFAAPDRLYVSPTLLSSTSSGLSQQYVFKIDSVDEFSAGRTIRGSAVETWRSYTSLAPGRYEFASFQQLTNGSRRLSDAIVMIVPTDRCARLSGVKVLVGDMQVAAVGRAFPINPIRVLVQALDLGGEMGASVALTSEAILDEALDTGIDGPTSAVYTVADGIAEFSVGVGNRPGVKRFIVKARQAGMVESVSAMITLLHVPAGSPELNSVPIIEYSYSDGADSSGRFLAATSAVTSLLDTTTVVSFSRTGQVWRAFTSADAAPGLSPVCQFFGVIGSGVVGHFFTADTQECAAQQSGTTGSGLRYEGVAFFAASPIGDSCPAAFPTPIVRYRTPGAFAQYRYLVSSVGNVNPPSGSNLVRERVAFCTDVAAQQ